MSLRAAFGAIIVGLVAALGIFFWTEIKTGRIAELIAFARQAERIGPPPLVTRPVPTLIPTSRPAASPTPRPLPTRAPPTRAPTPTDVPLPPTATRIAQVGVTADELDAELKRQVASSGLPLRNPSLQLQPPDRLLLRGVVPVAIFQIPVEIEGQLSVEDGRLKVTTTRVEAVGASLPASVATSLGQQVDRLGSEAVRTALPAGARATRVVVDAERITVDLA